MNNISKQRILSVYRFYAPFYDWLFGAVLEPGRQALMEAVRLLAPESALEVGVGTGLTLSRYPSSTAVVAVDVSQDMLHKARGRVDTLRGRDITLMAMDAEELAFPDDSFQCVVLPYVLSVTPNPDRLIREARRVCRTGGTIFVLNHFSGSGLWTCLEEFLRSSAARIGFRTDFSLQKYVLSHSWKIISISSVNLFGLSRLIEIQN
jgi:phosphatidylethanolamine/phosphatidyl-N-methylethanolamine N-methyltransferase